MSIETRKYRPDKVFVQSAKLFVHALESEEDRRKYDIHLRLFPENPFYRKELLFSRGPEAHTLLNFTLEYQKETVALMPIFRRKVVLDGVDTGYFDVTSPYGYSGPLFQKHLDIEIVELFWNQVDQWYREHRVVTEFIRFNIEKNWTGYNGQLQPTLKNICGKILPEPLQWNNFKPKVRNNYRRALKEGLRVKIFHEEFPGKIIKDFFAIYINTMLRRNAMSHYFYPIGFFERFIHQNPQRCAIAMAYKEDIPVSAELLLLGGDKIYSFLGGSEADYFKFRPNDLLKLEVLNWGRKNGYAHYFLGGGRMNGDSLFKYKKDFFPKDKEAVFYTGRKIIDKEVYKQLTGINPYCVDCLSTTFFPLYRCRQSY
ncbi:MAG TPA: GNAT family N-acetyltransferase [Eudoraea sp.]|nr:GNAT family N-acetyltransferase [Eudoraea sp.]